MISIRHQIEAGAMAEKYSRRMEVLRNFQNFGRKPLKQDTNWKMQTQMIEDNLKIYLASLVRGLWVWAESDGMF